MGAASKIPAGDLAGPPQEVWATRRDGLLHSTDSGAAFRPVPGAPALAAVEQPTPGRLIALTADGKVLSGGDGTSWTEWAPSQAVPGAPY
ncbi:hypothetical protein ACFWUZ_02750 [Streptomyces sp. NPDC058646]|uniref:hypothetical protein n=1 Tax=Streptomyces sp. NPDC058646 TaxID=3346574 RepID=UPI00365C3C0E